MFFLLSGEGPTDLGHCGAGVEICEGADFLHGPLAVFVDQLVEAQHHYSPLESGQFGFASKSALMAFAGEVKSTKKLGLPGKKRSKETLYFYNNARSLARIALKRREELNDCVVAILFRDSDGTASAGRGLWRDKRASIQAGFLKEGFDHGVAMVPKPKSEAWLLCAIKNGYRDCDALVDRSGNDNSPNSLKAELDSHSGQTLTRDLLCQMIADGVIDCLRIDMPSFSAFRIDLERAISSTAK